MHDCMNQNEYDNNGFQCGTMMGSWEEDPVWNYDRILAGTMTTSFEGSGLDHMWDNSWSSVDPPIGQMRRS